MAALARPLGPTMAVVAAGLPIRRALAGMGRPALLPMVVMALVQAVAQVALLPRPAIPAAMGPTGTARTVQAAAAAVVMAM